MAIMMMHEEWSFKVNKSEMLLILKALGGRLKGADLVEEARELGDRLTMSRITEMEAVTLQLRKALDIGETG
jgi:hypothetical protein